jgi:hypothetical protein
LVGPFGAYTALVAGITAIGVLGAWIATLIGVAPPSPLLDSVALLVIGVIFGTGAGATIVTNGVHREAQAANARLDKIHAPPAAGIAVGDE